MRHRGLGPARPPDGRVLVLIGAGRRHRTVGGVQLRPSTRADASSQLWLDDCGLRQIGLASPARAIADTALAGAPPDAVRALVAAAIQRQLCTPEQIAATLATAPRRNSAGLRSALVDAVENAHSVAEADAIRWLRRGRVDGFVANAPIVDAHGQLLFRVDLLWPALRAVLEIDSREFHLDEQSWKATMRRHNALTTMGYVVVHYPPSAIRAGGLAWVAEVQAWLASIGREPVR